MIPDVINASFEFLSGFFILNHCRVLLKDKAVAGVSILTVGFFSVWGVWNMYYYPYLGQMLSFWGGLFVVSANTLYTGLLLYFKHGRKINAT